MSTESGTRTRWRVRAVASGLLALLASGAIAAIAMDAIAQTNQKPPAPIVVGQVNDFPPGSVTYLVLPTTFYDPMRRQYGHLAALRPNQARPSQIFFYLREIIIRQLPLTIGRVSPVSVFLVHDSTAGWLTLYQRDPYRGCRIVWIQVARRFVDPCHGSEYTQLGAYLRGPAPRGLDRFAVWVKPTGEVVVNVDDYQIGPSHP